MANFRPAGMSDDDSDSDDCGFYEKPQRRYKAPPENPKKKLEINLQDAIINGRIKDVELIITLDLHGNVNVKLDSGWTPLLHACFHAQEKIVQLLLDKGADPNMHSESVTPIMVACSNSSADNDTIESIVTNLIMRDCILNVGDKHGQTPLMRAIGSGRVAVVQKLLAKDVNIEMRDAQGWTALFWAVHHNQPEILEILIAAGARLTEVDKMNRNPMEIAFTHDHQNIVDILNKHLKTDDEEENNICVNYPIVSWQDYYPGLMEHDQKPDYKSEIPRLLYGMNCDRLVPIFAENDCSLRDFLLTDEAAMLALGVTLPYERQRLKYGLYKFHTRRWKLSAVAGLYARKMKNYSVIDCLTSLGTHYQQIYILEATLQYTLREFNKIHEQLKFEPPDSPTRTSLKSAVKKMQENINMIRKEINIMTRLLDKISRSNPPPADLIKPKSLPSRAVSRLTDVVLACALAALAYHAAARVARMVK
ncbi:unnamed protein product [Plutella xylostella]|uniref:(diamondback moth) hypothetical protein n=1 Tax=Plutella xylostella TaxID=51655 RepID=A0A8S4D2X9_PLUXY|nr:unnamed protein product [Plutella xylostella]